MTIAADPNNKYNPLDIFGNGNNNIGGKLPNVTIKKPGVDPALNTYDWQSDMTNFDFAKVKATKPAVNPSPYLPDVSNFPSVGTNPVKYGSLGDTLPGYNPNGESTVGFWDGMFGDGSAENPGYLIPGINAAAGAVGAYTGYQALELGKDQFNFAKAESNRDVKNTANQYNMLLENSWRTAQSGKGTYANDANPERFETDLAAYLQQNSADGSAIG